MPNPWRGPAGEYTNRGSADSNAESKAIVLLLKTLQTAYNFKDQLKDLRFKGVEVDLTLGLSPKVNVGFLN